MPSLPSAPWAGQLPTEPAPWTLSLPPDIFSRGSPLPSGGAMRASGSIAIQPSHPIWMVSPDFAIPFVSCFACSCFYFTIILTNKHIYASSHTYARTPTHSHTYVCDRSCGFSSRANSYTRDRSLSISVVYVRPYRQEDFEG